MHKIKLFVMLITLAFTNIQCSSNTASKAQLVETPNINSRIVVSEPANELDVDGNLQLNTIENVDLETLLLQPAPDIWLVFSCQESSIKMDDCNQADTKQELPSETKEKINEYWKDGLKFRYTTILRKQEIDGKILYEEMMKFSRISNKLWDHLENTYVNTPSGKRKISRTEANEIVGFINDASLRVIRNAQAHKTTK